MTRLRELREESGLKLSDVAERLGTHTTAISKYELGQRQLTPELIIKFCSFYHCSADYLLGISDIRAPAAAAAAEAAPELLEAAKVIATLTPAQLEVFLKVIENTKPNEK